MQLAAIQKETVRFKRSEIARRQFVDGLMERVQIHPLLDTREREVRGKGPLFPFDSQTATDVIEFPCQFRQPRRLDAAPEHSRRPLIRKEPKILNVYRNRSSAWHARYRRLQFLQPALRPLADELGGDVQIGWRTPVDP